MILTRFDKCGNQRPTRAPSPPARHPRYSVQTYSRGERRLLTSANHFFFPSPKSRVLRLLTTPPRPRAPGRVIDSIQGLKTQKDLLSFDIYPTCSHSLSINTQLHEAARNGSYDPAVLERILGVNILVLGLAPELHRFLSVTPKEEVDAAIIDFLVLLHHQLESEGDMEGVRRLEEELEPTVNARMLEGIGIFPDGEPPPGRRADVLEQLVQLAFLTPWRVDVWGAYCTHADLQDLRSGVVLTGDKAPAKMIKDWIVLSDVLRGMVPDWGIADGLERAVSERRSAEIFARVNAVSRLVGDARSVLHGLPRDVVDGCVIPWVVRRECEVLPSRRRLVAPLESTPAGVKFLDELEAAGEDVLSRLAVDRDGLSLWRDWAATHGTAVEQEKDLCFSLAEKPWEAAGEGERTARLAGWDFGNRFSPSEDRENSSWGRSFIRNRRFLL